MDAPTDVTATTDDQRPELVLKNEYLARTKALSNLGEKYRSTLLTSLFAEALAIGVRAEAEFFLAAYGDSTGREYWHAQLSEPILIYKFAYVLAVHVAKRAEQLQDATTAVIYAFRDAAEAGEEFFRGDLKPLLALQDKQSDFAGLARIKVHPRAAVNWLLSKPMRQHHVPESLRSFLQFDQDAGKPRHVDAGTAERFVDDYIKNEEGQGRRPSIEGLEAAAKDAGMRGGRELLRAAFNRRMGGRRGRPAKASLKTAKK